MDLSRSRVPGSKEKASARVSSCHVSPPSGYELLYQPEVVRLYTSLLRESKNASVLEAAAGAIQNLCAGRWTVSDPDAPVPTPLSRGDRPLRPTHAGQTHHRDGYRHLDQSKTMAS